MQQRLSGATPVVVADASTLSFVLDPRGLSPLNSALTVRHGAKAVFTLSEAGDGTGSVMSAGDVYYDVDDGPDGSWGASNGSTLGGWNGSGFSNGGSWGGLQRLLELGVLALQRLVLQPGVLQRLVVLQRIMVLQRLVERRELQRQPTARRGPVLHLVPDDGATVRSVLVELRLGGAYVSHGRAPAPRARRVRHGPGRRDAQRARSGVHRMQPPRRGHDIPRVVRQPR